MFELPLGQLSAHVRTGPAQWVAEGVAKFGLLLVVMGHRGAYAALGIARMLVPARAARPEVLHV